MSRSRLHSFCFCLFSPKCLSEHDSCLEKKVTTEFTGFPHRCHWLPQLNLSSLNSLQHVFLVSLKPCQRACVCYNDLCPRRGKYHRPTREQVSCNLRSSSCRPNNLLMGQIIFKLQLLRYNATHVNWGATIPNNGAETSCCALGQIPMKLLCHRDNCVVSVLLVGFWGLQKKTKMDGPFGHKGCLNPTNQQISCLEILAASVSCFKVMT